MLYFLLFDDSLSSHFFRIHLVVFPAFFIGIALTAQRLWDDGPKRWAALALLALPILSGAPLLRPAPMVPLEAVTPPPGFLDGDRYMVNSSFYHPESLIYRYPNKQFIGLPIDPAQLGEFLGHYPDYREVLWHDFSVQPEVAEDLARRAEASRVRESVNGYGRRYRLLPLASRAQDQD